MDIHQSNGLQHGHGRPRLGARDRPRGAPLPLDIHANGDAAIDVALTAHEFAAADDLGRNRRTVMVHSQFVRRDQLDRYVEYNIIPSFFTEHAYYFGDAHVQ